MSGKHSEEYNLSLHYGEQVFDNFRQDRVPAWPELYEVLYTYAARAQDTVVAAVDEIRQCHGRLDAEALLEVYDHFLSCDRSLAVSDEVGNKIGEEIRKILTAMRAAGAKSEKFDLALRQIETKFTEIKTPDQLHGVVKILSEVTSSIASNNRSLTERLHQSAEQIDVLHKDLEKARNESNTDALTGLANRKKFDQTLRREIKNVRENGEIVSLLLTDIDFFKSFNDRYGHQTGDQVLRLVAHTLKGSVKGRDTAARYGGEEFAIILVGTHITDAIKVAEQIREAVKAKELIKRSTGENLGRITISIGLAEATSTETVSSLIERADKALYAAKGNGRNRCEIAEPFANGQDLKDIA